MNKLLSGFIVIISFYSQVLLALPTITTNDIITGARAASYFFSSSSLDDSTAPESATSPLSGICDSCKYTAGSIAASIVGGGIVGVLGACIIPAVVNKVHATIVDCFSGNNTSNEDAGRGDDNEAPTTEMMNITLKNEMVVDD